jgi:predicted tellurium resistance membrane protein TerC
MAIGWLVQNDKREIVGFNWGDAHYKFTLRNVVMLLGGLFLLYKTVKEIHHKLEGDAETLNTNKKKASFAAIMGQIIVIDMVFSFDSIITAVGLAKIVTVMIIAVVIAMIVMFFFADKISKFIHKHPTLKMLALAFLIMVGFSLFFEGVQPLHGSQIDKGYIYFAMAFSFGVELLNMWLRKKETRRQPVELREPQLPDTITGEYNDMAK